jgi:hypothetical protein
LTPYSADISNYEKLIESGYIKPEAVNSFSLMGEGGNILTPATQIKFPLQNE